jgi:hypothetical protein
MSVREGDNTCGNRDSCYIRRGLKEEAFTSHDRGETRRWGSRGGTAGEEGCTAGAVEEEDVCDGCSIEEGGLWEK